MMMGQLQNMAANKKKIKINSNKMELLSLTHLLAWKKCYVDDGENLLCIIVLTNKMLQ